MVKNLQYRRPRFDPWVRKMPWRREWQPTLVFLPGEFHGQRSLMGYSPRGGKKSEGLTLCFTKEDTESQGGGNDRSKVNC